MHTIRQTADQAFMAMAQAAATRSTCRKLNVGAVLVESNKTVSTGYNGAPSGAPHCNAPRKMTYQGFINRCTKAIHAEINAIDNYQNILYDATMYVTHLPCENCTKYIIKVEGIKRLVFQNDYGDPTTIKQLLFAGIAVTKLNITGEYINFEEFTQ